MSIHPTAIVDKGAKLGVEVSVGPHSYIGPNVVIGDRCKIHHMVTIEGYTTLGEDCEVYPQAILGTTPQDLKYSGEMTTLEIGKNNIFREMVTAHPGTGNGGGVTKIGDSNLFLIGVHIAHDCMIGSNCVIANYVQLAGHVHIEDNVNMGGHSAVHHFVTIGTHAFVGGMTRVSSDVPPFVIFVAARGPRPEIRMINGVGLQRDGYSYEDIGALKAAFMKLFSRRARITGSPIRDRVEALLADTPVNPHVEYLCKFLMRSFAHNRHGRYLEALRRDPVYRPTWKLSNGKTLTVNVEGSGAVYKRLDGDSSHSQEVFELTAVADPGHDFAGWNGDLTSRDNPIRVVIDENKTVTATFASTR